MDCTFVVEKFGAERIEESLDGMFGGAVGGLERDAAIGQRGTDKDDLAMVAGEHVLEGGEGAKDLAKVGDFGDAAVFFGFHLFDGGEDGGHGVIDPDVDGAQLLFDGLGGAVDGFGIGDIGRKNQSPAAGGLDFLGGGMEAVLSTGDETDVGLVFGKLAHDGTSDAGGSAGNDNDLGLFEFKHEEGSAK
jgi:hypothetical protein